MEHAALYPVQHIDLNVMLFFSGDNLNISHIIHVPPYT